MPMTAANRLAKRSSDHFNAPCWSLLQANTNTICPPRTSPLGELRVPQRQVKQGLVAPHHLRGCLELVRMGYEVALAEPLPDFWTFRRRPFPHDLRLWKMVRCWLGREGIIFCGHNVLVWMPLLKAVGLVRCHIVSNIFGCEELPLSRSHSGIITLTPPGATHARKLAPKVKVAHLGWGADLSVFPKLSYQPDAFFSCGITLRHSRCDGLAV